jgi:uncharacterized glyoxalase superfamily protein PhnB
VVVPRFTGFSITTGRRAESLAFYAAWGFAVQEDRHGGGRSCVDAPNQHFDVDDEAAVPSWNAGSTGVGVTIGFEVDTADEVDVLVARLAAAGHVVQQPPYDAPWGQRFAVVQDPDGVAVSFMCARRP